MLAARLVGPSGEVVSAKLEVNKPALQIILGSVKPECKTWG